MVIFAGGLCALAAMAQSSTGNEPAPAPSDADATASAQRRYVRELSLGEALKAAQDNLDVSLARRALEAAQGDVQAADRAPYPVLSSKLSQMDLQNGIGGGSVLGNKRIDKSIGLDWVWERGNKRVLRTQAAQSSARAAQSDLDEIRIQQQLATSASFYDLLGAQERAQEVSAIARSARALADSAAKRVQAGDLAVQDAARTEIEAQRAEADLQSAALDAKRAQLTLAALLGRNDAPDYLRVQADWPSVQPTVAPSAWDAAAQTRADVQAATLRLAAAQSALETALAQRHADLTWGASLDHYPGTSTRLLELRLQVPLQGLWGGYNQDGEITRAQAAVAQAEDVLEKTRRLARLELQSLYHTLASAAARAQRYTQEILPRARSVAERAELAYQKGALPLGDLLDARRTLRATLIEGLSARTDHAKATLAWQLRTATP